MALIVYSRSTSMCQLDCKFSGERFHDPEKGTERPEPFEEKLVVVLGTFTVVENVYVLPRPSARARQRRLDE